MKRIPTKHLLVRLVAATLIGASLPAVAAAPATAATCQTGGLILEGYPLPAGQYICEYDIGTIRFDGRWHAFLVGTNHEVYHTWMGSQNNGWNQSWVSLGGWAESPVGGIYYPTVKILEIIVTGSDDRPYCKYFNHPNLGGRGVWSPSQYGWYGINDGVC